MKHMQRKRTRRKILATEEETKKEEEEEAEEEEAEEEEEEEVTRGRSGCVCFTGRSSEAPDGLSGEVGQWQDFLFLLRLCPFFVCDCLGACSRRRTILTSRHLVVPFSSHRYFFSFIMFCI